MKTIFLLILVSLFHINLVYGMSGTPNQIFKPISKVNLEKVINRGISKIGNLDLTNLYYELDSVEWRLCERGFLTGSGGIRTTSIYLVEQKMVVVNFFSLQNLMNKPVPLPGWALHEALGALGYNDENYEMSSAITFITENPELDNFTLLSYVKENFLSVIQAKKNQMYVASGGSTVVGGGGDAVIIQLKQILLKRYLETMKVNNSTSEKIHLGFNRLLNLEIEFDFEGNAYNKFGFIFNEKYLLLDMGGQYLPEQIYKTDYIDKILHLISPYLLN
jgi:hypothetical protein